MKVLGLPCCRQDAGLRSITFERPSSGVSYPDAADGLPASLRVALCCCKSGSDEACQGQSRNAVSGDGGVGSSEGNAGKQQECAALARVDERHLSRRSQGGLRVALLTSGNRNG